MAKLTAIPLYFILGNRAMIMDSWLSFSDILFPTESLNYIRPDTEGEILWMICPSPHPLLNSEVMVVPMGEFPLKRGNQNQLCPKNILRL